MSSSGPNFTLPRDGLVFAEGVFERCRDQISYGVWSGIEPLRLDAWINNFQDDEGRYFAACILDALIYRSAEQTVSLMKQLFQRVLPDYSRRSGPLLACLHNVYDKLKGDEIRPDPKIRLVPVLASGQPYSKSAPTIARMLKRHLRFGSHLLLSSGQVPDALAAGVEAIIFIDDFLGTGDQFRDFLRSEGLDTHVAAGRFIYAPLTAHLAGINQLSTLFPSLHLRTVELLDDSNAAFHGGSTCFSDGVNSPNAARSFYYDLLEHHGIPGADAGGYGHLELLYAFEHSVPDNSLPILWWPHNQDWRPLLDK